MPKPIPPDVIALFETVLAAAAHGALGIISTEDKRTGETRYVLATGQKNDDGTVNIDPLGYLSPTVFDEVDPPEAEGAPAPIIIPDEPLPAMDDFTATMIAEGVMEASEDRQLLAWQHLVDTGLAWKLQGTFGRTAQHMIEQGLIEPANRNEKDEADAA